MEKEERENYRTHEWLRGVELPICLICGESPISLGFWGDEGWRRIHHGWKRECAKKVSNPVQLQIALNSLKADNETLEKNNSEAVGPNRERLLP